MTPRRQKHVLNSTMAIPDLTKPQVQHRSMTLATQAMEAFGISGQQGARHRGWHRASPPRQASMEKDSPLPWAKPLHGGVPTIKGKTTHHPPRKSEGTVTARSRSVPCSSGRRRCGGLRTTVRSWPGPVAVPAGSATITATRRSQRRQSRPTGGAIQTRNRTLEHYRAPRATDMAAKTRTCKPPPHLAVWNKLHEAGTGATEAELEHGRGDGRPTARAPRATHTPEGNGTTQVCIIKLRHSARNAEVTPNRPRPSRHSPRDGAPDHQPHARARQETKARRGRGRKREINGAA
jgi:hypothetical protein